MWLQELLAANKGIDGVRAERGLKGIWVCAEQPLTRIWMATMAELDAWEGKAG